MNRYKRRMVYVLAVLALASGLLLIGYPYMKGNRAEKTIQAGNQEFYEAIEEKKAHEEQEAEKPAENKIRPYPKLWADAAAYNANLWEEEQKQLRNQAAYETPPFTLADYSLPSEVFAVLSIPAIELKMPVYLGAGRQHLADGAAVLGQTSIPIGGRQTNSVIAGHRGWGSASYFRNITELRAGDEVYIDNPWERLCYRVTDTKIIEPDEVATVHIQQDRDLITLMTCCRYAGRKQRYLVFCEREER